jgi:hypothetical protein
MFMGWLMSFGIHDIDIADYGSGAMDLCEIMRVSCIEGRRQRALDELLNNEPVEVLEEMLMSVVLERGLGASSCQLFAFTEVIWFRVDYSSSGV